MSVISREDAQKWVDTLRSGKYQQARARLQDYNGYCCLGVACELFADGQLVRNWLGQLEGRLPMDQKNVPKFLVAIQDYEFGIDGDGDAITLAVLNDNGTDDVEPLDFDEIADVIQAEFVESNFFGVQNAQ